MNTKDADKKKAQLDRGPGEHHGKSQIIVNLAPDTRTEVMWNSINIFYLDGTRTRFLTRVMQ